jgi:hypothetical protein
MERHEEGLEGVFKRDRRWAKGLGRPFGPAPEAGEGQEPPEPEQQAEAA